MSENLGIFEMLEGWPSVEIGNFLQKGLKMAHPGMVGPAVDILAKRRAYDEIIGAIKRHNAFDLELAYTNYLADRLLPLQKHAPELALFGEALQYMSSSYAKYEIGYSVFNVDNGFCFALAIMEKLDPPIGLPFEVFEKLAESTVGKKEVWYYCQGDHCRINSRSIDEDTFKLMYHLHDCGLDSNWTLQRIVESALGKFQVTREEADDDDEVEETEPASQQPLPQTLVNPSEEQVRLIRGAIFNMYDRCSPMFCYDDPYPFFRDSLRYLRKTIGERNYIVFAYDEFYSKNHSKAKMPDLKDFLKKLIDDPTKYVEVDRADLGD